MNELALPKCDLDLLALQIEVLSDGSLQLAKSLAAHFDRTAGAGWFGSHCGALERLASENVRQRATKIATRWFDSDPTDVLEDPPGAESTTKETRSHPPEDLVLEDSLLRHVRSAVGAERAFLGLISPVRNLFDVSHALPDFLRAPLGRGMDDAQSLIGLIVNWKCPFRAGSLDEVRKAVGAWWTETTDWGPVESVLAIPLIVINPWPDGTPFPYPVGALYFEHSAKGQFDQDDLVLMTLVAKLVAPWMIAYRRAIGLAKFRATTRIAQNESPRAWPYSLSRHLAKALEEQRAANRSFALHSVVRAGKPVRESDIIDALVGVDGLASVDKSARAELQGIFETDPSEGDEDAAERNKQVPRECRKLANQLALGERAGITHQARQSALQVMGSVREAHCGWDCSQSSEKSVRFFEDVVSTLSWADVSPTGIGGELLLVSLTAECCVRTMSGGSRSTWSLDDLRDVGAQGWLREPYFFRFDDVQYLRAIGSKLAESIRRRHTSTEESLLFPDFCAPSHSAAAEIRHAFSNVVGRARDNDRPSVLLIRGAVGTGKTSLARAFCLREDVATRNGAPLVLDRYTASPFLIDQMFGTASAPGVLLVDDLCRADGATLEALAGILESGRHPNVVHLLTYTCDQREPRRTQAPQELGALLRKLDHDPTLVARLQGLLGAHAVVIDLHDSKPATEELLQVIRGHIELEKALYERGWRDRGVQVGSELVLGPDDAGLERLSRSWGPDLDSPGVRLLARTWIHLAERKQFGTQFDASIHQLRLEEQDLDAAIRVHAGGAVLYREDYEATLQEIGIEITKGEPDEIKREAMLCVLQALARLHRDSPGVESFRRHDVENATLDIGKRRVKQNAVVTVLRKPSFFVSKGLTHKQIGLEPALLRRLGFFPSAPSGQQGASIAEFTLPTPRNNRRTSRKAPRSK